MEIVKYLRDRFSLFVTLSNVLRFSEQIFPVPLKLPMIRRFPRFVTTPHSVVVVQHRPAFWAVWGRFRTSWVGFRAPRLARSGKRFADEEMRSKQKERDLVWEKGSSDRQSGSLRSNSPAIRQARKARWAGAVMLFPENCDFGLNISLDRYKYFKIFIFSDGLLAGLSPKETLP